MANEVKSGSVWILENSAMGDMIYENLYLAVKTVYPEVHIIAPSVLSGLLKVNPRVDIDENIQAAFDKFYSEKPLNGTTILVAHVNSKNSLDTICSLAERGVKSTARVPSKDVVDSKILENYRKKLDSLGIPNINSGEFGYLEWVSHSVLDLLGKY